MVPEIDLTDPGVLGDPLAAYGEARERGPVARLVAPGMAMWAVTRYAEARAMLNDPRFELSPASYLRRTRVPDEYAIYMRTMQEMEGAEHTRLRRLVSPAFTPRRMARFRERIEQIVGGLLDALPEGPADLLEHFARPLPMDVICEIVGIPEPDRPAWREHGAAVASGDGAKLEAAIPAVLAGAKTAVARRRAEPGPDLISDLVRVQADDGDRLTDEELVTLVWQLVLAGQTPANLIANAVVALLGHPAQFTAVRADDTLMPRAVEELTRWCGPQLLAIPRFTGEDVEIGGVRIPKGEPVTAAIGAANRDPRVFADPDRLDLARDPGTNGHLGYAHGPHFCLGAALARLETQVALTALLRRFPDLALAEPPVRPPDPGTWRLASLRAELR
ncbi:cytochrome P450 family protein [Nonomuraea sp. SBT364]|uniref:cytochrome P450 family protein n=1 Tax=Nonomuraea sp. SBT364 TaxID=1580530 RepID=UPI00066BB6F7|nr:cytochrome P450 [Nonomuraea sp. SBT364]